MDNVGVLHDTLSKQFKNKMTTQEFEYNFGLLYSLYSMPNIILPFIGGILMLNFGVRFVHIVCATLIALGQLTFACGCRFEDMFAMLIGRTIFGLGGETINVTLNALVVKWFYKSSIALPLGLAISIARFGSVLNDVISPRIAYVDVRYIL